MHGKSHLLPLRPPPLRYVGFFRETEIFSIEFICRGSTDSKIFEERVPLLLIAEISSCQQGDLQQRATSEQHKCFVFMNPSL